MKLSTIIPVYNAEKFINRCLDSVLNQNLNEMEIICVDDGSTDSSWLILEEYSKKFDNVHCFRQQNQFAGVARNAGLRMAQGKYIHFLDVDDYLSPDVYKELYEYAVSKGADYVRFRSRCFSASTGIEKSDEHGEYTCAYLKPDAFDLLMSIEDHPYELIEASTCVPWAGIFKRSFLQDYQIEFNKLKCVNDRSFYIEVITSTKQIIYKDKYVVNHLIENPKSLVGSRGDNFECHFSLYSIIKNYLKKIQGRINDELHRRILTRELIDILLWYSCLSVIQKDRIMTKLYKFFLEFDWSEINKCEIIYEIMSKINVFLDKEKAIRKETLINLPQLIRKYKFCYLYGAGVMAVSMIQYLKSESIWPDAVIVTSDCERAHLEGVRISKIGDFYFPQNNEEIIIILAAKSNYHLQMLYQLKQHNIRNIITISDKDFDKLLEIRNLHSKGDLSSACQQGDSYQRRQKNDGVHNCTGWRKGYKAWTSDKK